MLITVLVIVLIVLPALYLVQMLPVDGRINLALQAVIIIIAIIYLAHAAGLG